MTRIAYDCEFLEDGETIELISIGLVSEPGDVYYAVNRDFRWQRIAGRRWYTPWRWKVRHQWLLDHVVPTLPQLHGDARNHAGRGPLGLIDWQSPYMKSRARIAEDVHQFLASHPDVELWADYGAYDHVCLAQLFGTMMDRPESMPMFTCDLQQELRRRGNPEIPQQESTEHNALADARHVRDVLLALDAA